MKCNVVEFLITNILICDSLKGELNEQNTTLKNKLMKRNILFLCKNMERNVDLTISSFGNFVDFFIYQFSWIIVTEVCNIPRISLFPLTIIKWLWKMLPIVWFFLIFHYYYNKYIKLIIDRNMQCTKRFKYHREAFVLGSDLKYYQNTLITS
jgi:hypothetical protein